jgi:acyl-coenzyme A synthetase/AMP-(fatty) acid ligase
VAFVCWREGVPQEQERLLAHLRERVPLYMIPEQWHRVERLPRTSNGKVDRVARAQDAERLEGTTTLGG